MNSLTLKQGRVTVRLAHDGTYDFSLFKSTSKIELRFEDEQACVLTMTLDYFLQLFHDQAQRSLCAPLLSPIRQAILEEAGLLPDNDSWLRTLFSQHHICTSDIETDMHKRKRKSFTPYYHAGVLAMQRMESQMSLPQTCSFSVPWSSHQNLFYHPLYNEFSATALNSSVICRGGIITDESGVDTTPQIVQFLRERQKSPITSDIWVEENGKPLLLTNASLVIAAPYNLHHWLSCFARLAPDIKVAIMGTNCEFKTLMYSQIMDAHVVLTTWNVIENSFVSASGAFEFWSKWKTRPLEMRLQRRPCLDHFMFQKCIVACSDQLSYYPFESECIRAQTYWVVQNQLLHTSAHIVSLMTFLRVSVDGQLPGAWKTQGIFPLTVERLVAQYICDHYCLHREAADLPHVSRPKLVSHNVSVAPTDLELALYQTASVEQKHDILVSAQTRKPIWAHRLALTVSQATFGMLWMHAQRVVNLQSELRRLEELLHEPSEIIDTCRNKIEMEQALMLRWSLGSTRIATECSICLETATFNALTGCGHTFCRGCFHLAMVQCGHRCPCCREPVDLTRDVALFRTRDTDAVTQKAESRGSKIAAIVRYICDMEIGSRVIVVGAKHWALRELFLALLHHVPQIGCDLDATNNVMYKFVKDSSETRCLLLRSCDIKQTINGLSVATHIIIFEATNSPQFTHCLEQTWKMICSDEQSQKRAVVHARFVTNGTLEESFIPV